MEEKRESGREGEGERERKRERDGERGGWGKGSEIPTTGRAEPRELEPRRLTEQQLAERRHERLPLIRLEKVGGREGSEARPRGDDCARRMQPREQPGQLEERRQVRVHLVVQPLVELVVAATAVGRAGLGGAARRRRAILVGDNLDERRGPLWSARERRELRMQRLAQSTEVVVAEAGGEDRRLIGRCRVREPPHRRGRIHCGRRLYRAQQRREHIAELPAHVAHEPVAVVPAVYGRERAQQILERRREWRSRRRAVARQPREQLRSELARQRGEAHQEVLQQH